MSSRARFGFLAVLAAAVVARPACADVLVREIGSFHIGGHEVVLSGQPTKEVSFTAGMPPLKSIRTARSRSSRCTYSM